jgi:hypothetical protein
MRVYLAQSFPDGWGGEAKTVESMNLYLATWPPEKQIEQTLGQASAQEEAMKIHLAERDPQHHSWPKNGVDKEKMHLRILLSYWYYKDTDLDALFSKYFLPPYPDVFADSGGFSAMTQGAEIDIKEYAAWVKRWHHLFSVYANLDVIGNPKGTAKNQAALEDMGLNPLPVFHTGSDFAELEALIDKYSYIALGGMVPHMRYPKRIIPWLIKAFKAAKGEAVFHGFGCTSWRILSALPWYSVDSSSWGQGFRFGQVPVFDEQKGHFIEINLGDVKGWQKHQKLVSSLGFNPLDFADRKRNDRAKICAISALSYMKAEQWLRRRHGEIFIPGKPDAPAVLRAHLVDTHFTDVPPAQKMLSEAGVRLHLADANPARFGEAVQDEAGIRLHLADTSNGVNYGDADRGLKIHLADARGERGGEIAAADTGLKNYLGASIPSQKAEWLARQATQGNDSGLKLHLAEHSMDRGG